MDALKQPFLVDGERCWKNGEGHPHLPVGGEGENRCGVLEQC